MYSREYIKGFVDKYIQALEKNDFSGIPVSEVYKYSENCEAERDSRFKLMDVADGYWRAMETEGTADYVRPAILPDTERYENGMHTTNEVMPDFSEIFGDSAPLFIPAYPFPDSSPHTALADFDHGTWRGTGVKDRRYPVIDNPKICGEIINVRKLS